MFDTFIRNSISHWSRVYRVTVEPALVRAIIQRESSGGKFTVTKEPGGRFSYGPMMVLDTTAKAFGVADPKRLAEPGLGIWYGVRNLAELLQRFAGDIERAVSAYNTGPSRAARSPVTGKFPNQTYVDAVMKFYRSYQGAILPALGLVALVAGYFLLKRRRAA